MIRTVIYLVVIYFLWSYSLTFRKFLTSPIQFAKGISTAIELRQIKSAMEQYKVLNGGYPSNFDSFMSKTFTSASKSVLVDSWGMNYRCERYDWGYLVFSAGSDQMYNTKDDYYIKIINT